VSNAPAACYPCSGGLVGTPRAISRRAEWEGVEGLVGLLTSLGHPDLVQVCLGSGLYALGHLVEHVGAY
jgi:hypothetical protein